MRQPSHPTFIDLGLALTPILNIVALLPQNEQIGAQLSTYDTLQRFLVLGAILYDCSVYSRVPRHNMTNAWLYGSVCNMEEGGGGGGSPVRAKHGGHDAISGGSLQRLG